ncbi:hypothetical protein ACOSQ2_004607 [Xanthoceras sorbifolium]
MTFITYRQKGVMDAIKTWWLGSSNKFCVRHIFAILKVRHRENTSADLVFKTAKITNKKDFDDVMKKMKEEDMDAYNYMSRIPVFHWSRHTFDGHVKSVNVTNNISECFNSWIDKFRVKPALTLLENLLKAFYEVHPQKA